MAGVSSTTSAAGVSLDSQSGSSQRVSQRVSGASVSPTDLQARPDWPLSPIPSPSSITPDLSRFSFDDNSDKENRPPNVPRFPVVVNIRIWRGAGVQRLIGKINGRFATSRPMPLDLGPEGVRHRIRQLERELRSLAAENPAPWV
jgi:hypothetical protein